MRGSFFRPPIVSAEREPLSDAAKKEVEVVIELPGISKENIEVNSYDRKVEVFGRFYNR